MSKKGSDNSANRSQGYNPKSGGGAKSKDMADELKKTQLGKAAKRARSSQSPKGERRKFTGSKKPAGPQAIESGPRTRIRSKVRKSVHRQWYSANNSRRCQHAANGKQCIHSARQGTLTCSAHSRLEDTVRDQLIAPYGPDWMRRIKRDIKSVFGKDLDFWTFLPLKSWKKASDVIDVAIDAVPERLEELYVVLEQCGEDLRPAARLARAMLRDKFMLNAHEESELAEMADFLYKSWKQSEFFSVFGRNGIDSSNIRTKPDTPGASVRPPDNRSRKDLKKARRSVTTDGKILFLEVAAIEAETQLFATSRGKKDRFNKSPLDIEISNVYNDIRDLEREIANSQAPRPILAKKLKELSAKLDMLVENRKCVNHQADELRMRAQELRARQAELMGGPLQGSIVEGRFTGPEKWYWKLSLMRNERNTKTTKKVGNRGKHASKKTSKKRTDKGVAGVGHCANVRGRFAGMVKEKDWDTIIADNGRCAIPAPEPVVVEEVHAQVVHRSRIRRSPIDVGVERVMTEVVS